MHAVYGSGINQIQISQFNQDKEKNRHFRFVMLENQRKPGNVENKLTYLSVDLGLRPQSYLELTYQIFHDNSRNSWRSRLITTHGHRNIHQ